MVQSEIIHRKKAKNNSDIMNYLRKKRFLCIRIGRIPEFAMFSVSLHHKNQGTYTNSPMTNLGQTINYN